MKQLKAQHIGLITGVVMIAASVIFFYVLHLPAVSKSQLVVYSIYSAGVIGSLLLFHNSAVGDKKFKDYFSEGFKTFIVVVLFMAVYTFIFVKINPSIIGNFIIENNKLLSAQGNRTPAEIATNADKIRSAFLLTMVMGAIITYLIIGALISIIGAGFLSRKKAGNY